MHVLRTVLYQYILVYYALTLSSCDCELVPLEELGVGVCGMNVGVWSCCCWSALGLGASNSGPRKRPSRERTAHSKSARIHVSGSAHSASASCS